MKPIYTAPVSRSTGAFSLHGRIMARFRPHLKPTRNFAASCILVTLCFATSIRAADVPVEELLAKAFDETTGTPFASIMLSIIQAGAHSQQDPAVLDARLQAVEAALRSLDARFQ